MTEEKDIQENKGRRGKRRRLFRISAVKDVMDGSVLTNDKTVKQLPFFLFLMLIALLYIGNRYNAEKIVRETNKIQDELKELRSEQIAITSELMQISKQSEVIKLIEASGLGLIESTEPPVIINTEN
ncbi:MAG: FtsL-like putative cell division protein [Bacteroidota bacterium]